MSQMRFLVVTSALLSFLISFDEVVIAMFVSGGDNPSLTRNLFMPLQDQINLAIASNSALMNGLTTPLMAVEVLFDHNKHGG